MSTRLVRFKHSGNLGDVIYALPSIKKYCELHRAEAELLLIVGAPMWLPSDLSHPSGTVMLTEHGVAMLKPLLLAQSYIIGVVSEKFRAGYKHQCDVDLDSFRSAKKFNLAMGSIARYYQTIFGFSPDVELPWLRALEEKKENFIVVARSSRYRNPNIDYSFLAGRGVKFVGVDSEYDDFLSKVPDAEYVKFSNFFELAVFISRSRLVIANQTFIYSIAEALKLDRILEPCLYAGNVIPCGGNNFEAFSQESFEFAVDGMSGNRSTVVDETEYLAVLRPWQDYLASRVMPIEDARKAQLVFKDRLPALSVIVDALECDENAVIRTIRSIEDQQLQDVRLIVVSRLEKPANVPDIVRWLQSVQSPAQVAMSVAENAQDGWLVQLKAGDMVAPSGLLVWAYEVATRQEKGLYYTDEDVFDLQKGPVSPLLKPDFDRDLLLSCSYIGRFLLCRGREYLELGGVHEYGSARVLDYVLRFHERFGSSAIGHLAEIVFHGEPIQEKEGESERRAGVIRGHLLRSNITANVVNGILPGSLRVQYLHKASPLVTIIVPTKNQMPMLSRCIETLMEVTAYKNYELLIVDNQSTDADAVLYLQGLADMNLPSLQVLSYPHAFNFADMNNLAVREARGEYLVLLNNDTAIIKSDWLDALLNHAQRPEVGIVGAKLLYPDGKIQHGGVILGLRGPADHPFIGKAMDAPGYCGRLQVDQQYSAVTAACMMVRKSIYESVGGMDAEAFKVSYNDVDFCLKVREAGYRIIWTPHAIVMHEGNVSQKQVDLATHKEKLLRFKTEQRAMYHKWLPALIADPAYNPNLSLKGEGFELETAAMFNPYSSLMSAKVLAHNGDTYGSGHYRVIQPLQALVASDLGRGDCSDTFLDTIHIAKLAPDVIVLQRQLTDGQLSSIQTYREFSGAKIVYELDDYLPNLPISSVHKKDFPKDIWRRLRQITALCDRVTVSTPALKTALKDLHSDILVLPNYLPMDWWGNIASRSKFDKKSKPRVGWAGGWSHKGDLRLISDVVKATADRVDWVFFGMKPEGIESIVAEYYPGVPIEDYPRQLAALKLDLALAPLENNLFNECKSNLRLLEYGICGYPVIATDIEPYRCELPVTLVKNRFNEWVTAIEEKLADREALLAEGMNLQSAVRNNWMLEGANLMRWRDGWMLNDTKTEKGRKI